jgi:hypothetical protein
VFLASQSVSHSLCHDGFALTVHTAERWYRSNELVQQAFELWELALCYAPGFNIVENSTVHSY